MIPKKKEKEKHFSRHQVGDSEMFLSLAGVRGSDIQMLVGTFDRNPSCTILHWLGADKFQPIWCEDNPAQTIIVEKSEHSTGSSLKFKKPFGHGLQFSFVCALVTLVSPTCQ